MDNFISSLTGKLSSGSKVLSDQAVPEFRAAMGRWSNIDVKVPFVIVQPADEQDIVSTVQGALEAGIPFVPASGGHSLWSTIGQEGIIIDLSRYTGVVYNAETNEATAKGGTLMKEMQTTLHPHKRFAGT